MSQGAALQRQCDGAGEEEDFAQKYLQAFLRGDAKHGNSSLHVHERFEMASAVTPVNSSAFAMVRRAILETLAKDRVRSSPTFTYTFSFTILLLFWQCAMWTCSYKPSSS